MFDVKIIKGIYMKIFTTNNTSAFDIVHIIGNKDDYTISEADGIITYESTNWGRKYIVNGNEELIFKRPNLQGKFKFKWDDEIAPFITPTVPTDYIANFPLNNDAVDTTGNFIATTSDLSYHNGSVQFDGDGDYFEIPFGYYPTVTFNFWLKIPDNEINRFIGCDASTDPEIQHFAKHNADNTFVFFQGNNTTSFNATTTKSFKFNGQFANLSLVWRLNTLDLYINGLHFESLTFNGDRTDTAATVLYLMRHTYYHEGNIGSFKIYDRALADVEISNIYEVEKSTYIPDKNMPTDHIIYIPLKYNTKDWTHTTSPVNANVTFDGISGYFNGSNAKVTGITIPQAYSTYTVSAWFKDNGSAAYGHILSNQPNWSFKYWCSHDSIYLHSSEDGSELTQDGTVPSNVWKHVVAIVDGSQVHFYIDGQFVISRPWTTDLPAIELGIGNYSDEWQKAWEANIRVYPRNISATEVLAIYETEKGEFL